MIDVTILTAAIASAFAVVRAGESLIGYLVNKRNGNGNGHFTYRDREMLQSVYDFEPRLEKSVEKLIDAVDRNTIEQVKLITCLTNLED